MSPDDAARAPYPDRGAAGRVLAQRLTAHRGRGTVVLGIPRGGVVVAAEVARALDAALDVVVARKLGAPGSPELAIGAVTAEGARCLNQDVIDALGVTEAYLDDVTRRERAVAREREARLRGAHAAVPLAGRTAVMVDDGLATGATMIAAVRSARAGRPARIVVAVPVGSRQACAALDTEADEVICPWRPEPFGAVGYYYERFEPVEDAEVGRLLADRR